LADLRDKEEKTYFWIIVEKCFKAKIKVI
jgi:hypothetical protein